MLKRSWATALSALFFTVAAPVSAEIVISTTRVIYQEKSGETLVQLRNPGSTPFLVQSWIDDGNAQAKPDSIRVPFSLSPAVARIDPKKSQALRILQTAKGLPADRESLFWLNVLEVPPKPTKQLSAGDNLMQFSFRSRIKMFYRPAGLSMTPAQAFEKLEFSLLKSSSRYQVRVKNPSPYYLTFRDLTLRHSKASPAAGTLGKTKDKMVPPFGELLLPMDGVKANQLSGLKAFYSLINDYGGDTPGERVLAHGVSG